MGDTVNVVVDDAARRGAELTDALRRSWLFS